MNFSILENASRNSTFNVSYTVHPPGAITPTANGMPGTLALVGIAALFTMVEVVGLTGNGLVILIILRDRKMRRSATNMFITNLAVADSIILFLGVPEIIVFLRNEGYDLGTFVCKFSRFLVVSALCGSVMTLVAVCIERYIAILHPMKASILCSRKRILMALACMWPASGLLSLPYALYNEVAKPGRMAMQICGIDPRNPVRKIADYYLLALLYFIPLVLQTVLYSLVSKKLFSGIQELQESVNSRDRTPATIKARKGVVKMLIACVVVYFVCYTPIQIEIIYKEITGTGIAVTYSVRILVIILGYINSAANPILYSIFSQKFRAKFKTLMFCQGRNLTAMKSGPTRMKLLNDRHGHGASVMLASDQPTEVTNLNVV